MFPKTLNIIRAALHATERTPEDRLATIAAILDQPDADALGMLTRRDKLTAILTGLPLGLMPHVLTPAGYMLQNRAMMIGLTPELTPFRVFSAKRPEDSSQLAGHRLRDVVIFGTPDATCIRRAREQVQP